MLVAVSCSIKPHPIQYGMDGCSYCSMTIVDRQHAAEYVTSKGKAFKFDAAECMLNQLKEQDIEEIDLFLVSDYETPGDLIDAREATYLISENIRSPMGANLSAFRSREVAQRMRETNPGILLTWEQLRDKFKEKSE